MHLTYLGSIQVSRINYPAVSSSFFSLQIKITICRMFTVLHIYSENIQYYFAEFNMVQKLKYTKNHITMLSDISLLAHCCVHSCANKYQSMTAA